MYLIGIDAETGEELAEATPCPICERMIKNSGINLIIGPQNLAKETEKGC